MRKKSLPAELISGIKELDAEHRELFDVTARLEMAARDAAPTTALIDLLDYLGRYGSEHFAHELRLMRAHGYPESEVEAHVVEHQEFVSALHDLRRDIETNTPVNALRLAAQMLEQWLQVHISTRDRELVAFLRRGESPASSSFPSPIPSSS